MSGIPVSGSLGRDGVTRLPSTLHALPVGARGDHRPSASCPCRPILATDMAEAEAVPNFACAVIHGGESRKKQAAAR